jgi:uncharacterized membrane protein
MTGNANVLAAVTAFVGSHFVLSHPLRRPLVAAMGDKGFAGLYSVVALATLVWIVLAYHAAPAEVPLWTAGNVLWAVVTVIMWLASVLLLGSLVKNPALPGPPRANAPAEARGVFAITRHPMLWAFTLWAVCHILIFPITANIIVAVAILVLSLAGAAAQDAKKRQLQPALWRDWEAKTSYWPFVAIAAGRSRIGGFGMHAVLGGTVVWLAATWAHIPLSGWPAGIWRWLR